MPNTYFQFKQFIIHQEKTAMKVGTDGVLLGAWTPVEKAKNILDIGTGTGLIALMMAQRTNANIEAIEIEKNAFKQATVNFESSKWCNRIKLHHTDLQKFSSHITKTYDLIVCNPPYFNNALISPEKSRAIARHTKNLSYEDLIKGVSKLLDNNGIFSVIIPADVEKKLDTICWEHNIYPSKKCYVIPIPGKEPKRIMIVFSKIKQTIVTETITIETGKRHQYSKRYISLTKDFYLKMG